MEEKTPNATQVDELDMEFIKIDLIPEMVHNRCFCEAGSREFVELESVSVKALIDNRKFNENCRLYEGKVTVQFSGEPQSFDIIIKLLPTNCQYDDISYGCFLNEEMFYNKMTLKLKLDIYPKCYVADMGRYGRPVIVLEDLRAAGYNHYCGKLDEDHRILLLEAIARFHGRGINLKESEFNVFREFYAKLSDVGADKVDYLDEIRRSLEYLRENGPTALQNLIKEIDQTNVTKDPNDNPFFTICHGNLNLNKALFLYENGKPVSVKIVGWNRMNYTCLINDLEYILIEEIQAKESLGQFHNNCRGYIDIVTRVMNACKNELLSPFLLALVYPRIMTLTEMCNNNESPSMNFLYSLQ